MELSVNRKIKGLTKLPINHNYPPAYDTLIAELETTSELSKLTSSKNLVIKNHYHEKKLPGTRSTLYARQAVCERLESLAELLLPNTGIIVFDAFRTIKTQEVIFEQIKQLFKKQHPDWSTTVIEEHVRLFVSHPYDKSHFAIPLHNSGGAVDLMLFDVKTDQPWDFGTEFDEMSEHAFTDYFESPYTPSSHISEQRWELIRHNRRTLYHLMLQFDFVNYKHEWWHYDLGDCYWASTLDTAFIYPSLEDTVNKAHPL